MSIREIKDLLSLEYFQEYRSELVLTLILVGVFLVLRKVSAYFLNLKVKDSKRKYKLQKLNTYFYYSLLFLILGGLWLKAGKSLATFLGLFSAGLAIALKDTLANLAGWLFILWRKPFQVGDRIQIGEHKGDVINLRIFEFTLMEIGNWVECEQSTGRVIHVPNSKLFSETTANYNEGFYFIWNEIQVLITFESDWEKAKVILEKIINERPDQEIRKKAVQKIRESSGKFMIFYSKFTPIVYTNVKDSGVLLSVRYLCEPKKRRESEQEIWEKILRELKKHSDIDLAYPTRRVFNNSVEGKHLS